MIGSLGIAVGYSVIIGWIIKFLVDSIDGSILNPEDPAGVFAELSQNFGSIPFGQVFAIVFFAAVLFAGMASLLNLLESPVEALQVQVRLVQKVLPGACGSRDRGGIHSGNFLWRNRLIWEIRKNVIYAA